MLGWAVYTRTHTHIYIYIYMNIDINFSAPVAWIRMDTHRQPDNKMYSNATIHRNHSEMATMHFEEHVASTYDVCIAFEILTVASARLYKRTSELCIELSCR